MTIALNSPLYVGQKLEPRPSSTMPKCHIIRFLVIDKILWTLETMGSKEQYEMTLSEVYANFRFPY